MPDEPHRHPQSAANSSPRGWFDQLADRYEALAGFASADAEAALRSLAEELGVKVGELVHPARYAISGQKVGPSLFDAMEVLGQETTVRRLREPKMP